MPERLLALDIGSVVGYAHAPFGATPVHGTYRLPVSSVRDLTGARLDRLDVWLSALILQHGVTAIVMAERFMVRNTGEAAVSFGLDGIVRMVAYRHHGVRVLVQPEGTVRKEMLGRGGGPTDVLKRLAMAWCQRHGFDVLTHHEADALVLWHWAELELGRASALVAAPPAPVRGRSRSARYTRRHSTPSAPAGSSTRTARDKSGTEITTQPPPTTSSG